MEVNQKLQDYILDAPIGAGGVGEVWRAHHTRLDKPVAIKVILPHLCRDADIYNRFEQEAIAMASLEHPHIVKVYDYFPVGKNACLVMSYVEGGSLEDLIKNRGFLGLAEALQISRGILGALDYAHRQHVVHRDVKPSNILVGPDLHAYLVDFGIALVLGKTRMTKFGTNVGTPEYMSPEQILGKNTDHQTDVYSFGCVLYEMLSGAPPFGTSTEKGLTDFTIMQRHVKEAPPPLRPANPEVDEKTEAIIMRALAKDRRERFAGCAEMLSALATPSEIRVGVREMPSAKTTRASNLTLAILMLCSLILGIGWIFTYSSLREVISAPKERLQTDENLDKELLDVKLARDRAIDQAEKYRQQLAKMTAQLQKTENELDRYLTQVNDLRLKLHSVETERDKAREKLYQMRIASQRSPDRIDPNKIKKILNRENQK